jgi:hypothetical protein
VSKPSVLGTRRSARWFQRVCQASCESCPARVSTSEPVCFRSSPSAWSALRKCRTGVVSLSRLACPIHPCTVGSTSTAALIGGLEVATCGELDPAFGGWIKEPDEGSQ